MRVSSVTRFSFRSPPPYMRLGWGVAPPLDVCWYEVFCSGIFLSGPGVGEASGVNSTLCESLGFLIMEFWRHWLFTS